MSPLFDAISINQSLESFDTNDILMMQMKNDSMRSICLLIVKKLYADEIAEFSHSDELMAREVMVPRTDAFMVDIQDDTQTIIESILKQSWISVYDDKDNVWIHNWSLLKAGFYRWFW